LPSKSPYSSNSPMVQMIPVNQADYGLPIFHHTPPIRMPRSVITASAPHVPTITSELLLIFVLIVNQCPVNFSQLSSVICPSISNLMQRSAPSHICSPPRHHASSALRQTRRRLTPLFAMMHRRLRSVATYRISEALLLATRLPL
jgi:hypothetical protein